VNNAELTYCPFRELRRRSIMVKDRILGRVYVASAKRRPQPPTVARHRRHHWLASSRAAPPSVCAISARPELPASKKSKSASARGARPSVPALRASLGSPPACVPRFLDSRCSAGARYFYPISVRQALDIPQMLHTGIRSKGRITLDNIMQARAEIR
jgi:hypothetical protein